MDPVKVIPEAGWIVLLVWGAVVDMKTERIPNTLNLALLLVSLAGIMPEMAAFAAEAGTWRALLYEAVLHGSAAVVLFLPMLLADLVRPGAFGGGDLKFAFAGGLLLRFPEAVDALAIAFALGSITALARIAGKKKGRFRFGPMLAAGMSAAFLAGRYFGWLF